MKILLICKKQAECNEVKAYIENYLDQINQGYSIDTSVVPFDQVQIQESYDLIFIRLCKKCLIKSKEYLLNIQRTYPDTKCVFISSNNDLIFDVQELHPFYFVRMNQLQSDLEKSLALFMNSYNQHYLHIIGNTKENTLNINDIIAVKIDDHYLNLYTFSESYMIRETISKFCEKYNFIRVTRSVAVNPKAIINRVNNVIYLKNGDQYEISSKYITE